MNAPAKVAPSRDRYIPIVKQHLPTCEGKALELRCSLLMTRDNATSSMRRCSDEAHGILAEIQRLATLYAFTSMPIEELAELRYRLGMLVACASGLEMFAYRLQNPGGANAGG